LNTSSRSRDPILEAKGFDLLSQTLGQGHNRHIVYPARMCHNSVLGYRIHFILGW